MSYIIFPDTNCTCIKLSYGQSDAEEYIIPFSEDFSLTANQEVSRPITELFNKIRETVTSVSGSLAEGTVEAVVGGGIAIQDLLGWRLLGRKYYMSAWKGVKESGLNLKLDLRMGWAGFWDAEKECKEVAYKLMGYTLPTEDNKAVLGAPMPAPIDVYATYGANAVNDALKTIGGFGETLGNEAKKAISSWTADSKKANETSGDYSKSTKYTSAGGVSRGPRTWHVVFGFWNSISGDANKFVDILDAGINIVQTSSLSQSSQVQITGSGKFVPIQMTVNLQMISQDVYTRTMFNT